MLGLFLVTLKLRLLLVFETKDYPSVANSLLWKFKIVSNSIIYTERFLVQQLMSNLFFRDT